MEVAPAASSGRKSRLNTLAVCNAPEAPCLRGVAAVGSNRKQRFTRIANGMYLTTIEHEGRTWDVELKVIHDGELPGTLEISFVHSSPVDEDMRYTWDVPAELVDVLHLEGRLSTQELRDQLAKALAEARSPRVRMPRGPNRSRPAAESFDPDNSKWRIWRDRMRANNRCRHSGAAGSALPIGAGEGKRGADHARGKDDEGPELRSRGRPRHGRGLSQRPRSRADYLPLPVHRRTRKGG
jgi:hypothetical protein